VCYVVFMSNTEHTAEDFNLYCSKPGVEAAALALNMAFLHAESQVVEGRMKKGEAFTKVISPVMEKLSSFGACDSDARDVIIDLWNLTIKAR
jgi:hypothetical protein